MHHSQHSKRMQELRDNDPTRRHAEKLPAQCLILYLPDGHGVIFYYLYLVKVEFLLQESLNTLILRFTSDKVTLEGYRLSDLFLAFGHDKPEEITVRDERYVLAGLIDGPAVINAIVEPIGG